jgi:hypothetical protein
MLGPFAFLKLGPVGRAREAFTVGGVEAEGHGKRPSQRVGWVVKAQQS